MGTTIKEQNMNNKEVEEAIIIVGPIAAKCGLTEDDTRIVVEYIDKMAQRGIAGRDAGMALRVLLKRKEESFE